MNMSPSDELRLGLIGYGYWGPNLLRNFKAAPGVIPVVLADKDERRLDRARALYSDLKTVTDAETLFADDSLDAICIATPVDTHYPMAKAALSAGKHVLVEKPMASSVEKAEELVTLARKNDKVLMVDHVFVFSPPVLKMKEIVDSGDLGELMFVDSIRINLGLFQHDVNVVWDLAPHDLSIVDHVTGRFPKSIATFGAAHAADGIEDVAYLNLDLGDGLIASFHVNWLSPVKVRYTMLGGREKTLVYNDLDPIEKIKVYDSGITIGPDDPEGRRGLLISYRSGDVWSPHIPQKEALREMVEHFTDCVKNGKKPITDGEAGLRIVRLLEAAQRSIKAQGGRVTL